MKWLNIFTSDESELIPNIHIYMSYFSMKKPKRVLPGIQSLHLKQTISQQKLKICNGMTLYMEY